MVGFSPENRCRFKTATPLWACAFFLERGNTCCRLGFEESPNPEQGRIPTTNLILNKILDNKRYNLKTQMPRKSRKNKVTLGLVQKPVKKWFVLPMAIARPFQKKSYRPKKKMFNSNVSRNQKIAYMPGPFFPNHRVFFLGAPGPNLGRANGNAKFFWLPPSGKGLKFLVSKEKSSKASPPSNPNPPPPPFDYHLFSCLPILPWT